jgi:hypothetical protein
MTIFGISIIIAFYLYIYLIIQLVASTLGLAFAFIGIIVIGFSKVRLWQMDFEEC